MGKKADQMPPPPPPSKSHDPLTRTNPTRHPLKQEQQQDEAEEDDYMSMTFSANTSSTTTVGGAPPESSLARRARLKREAEARSRPKSSADIRAEESAARAAALATSLDSTNKGFRMMEKLGFRAGGSLGKVGAAEGRQEPIAVVMKEDRGGIGLDAERKRKVREEFELEGKRVKAEEGEYRERVRREREEKRIEGLVWGAMSVAERLDEEAEMTAASVKDRETDGTGAGVGVGVGVGGETDIPAQPRPLHTTKPASKPLKHTNILTRPLLLRRLDRNNAALLRHNLQHSLSASTTYDDPAERLAMGTEVEDYDYEEEGDEDLDAHLALPAAEQLRLLVAYLRDRYFYCFWCKRGYGDAGMEGCPGVTEEEHD